ncbi:MAG: tripartite tricarboxylate transporter substrate binding protein [Burkholderiales bacterium]
MNLKSVILAPILVLLAGVALGQDKFPNKSIQLVAPLAAGTTIDLVARTYAELLAPRLGQSVVVQNRPGAGGTIAGQSVAKAAPDGYTILIVNSQHTINPTLYKSLPYDTLTEFAGIAQIGEAPSLIVVHPKLGARTLKEFIAAAKKVPGQIHYGSAGIGTTTHIGAAYFASRAGIELVHVPYKGGELVADMVAGRVEAMAVPVAFLLQHIKDGRLLALGVTTREPLKSPIEVPSVEEAAGLPGFQYATYYGFVAPAKTPRPIIEQLSREIRQVTADKALTDKFAAQAIFPRDLGPADFDAFIRADLERIGPVIKAIGATAN